MFTRATGRLYFTVQAVLGAVWWLLVFTVPAVRDATLGKLDPVWVAALDLPLFVAAAALVALGARWAVWVAVPWAVIVALAMVGYATVTGLAGWGALAMIAAAAGSVFAGLLVWTGRLPTELLFIGPFAFREAASAPTRNHVARTGAQITVFWGLFLVVLPLIIAWAEARWGLSIAVPGAVRVAGVVILVLASALGLWSSLAMSTKGAGTPLPSSTATQLVVAGPYRFVRNPMAVSGIVQGVAVGLILGSWLVVLYALCGSIVWNAIIRPHEEADLEARFGASFVVYRERVACWVPRLRGVRISE